MAELDTDEIIQCIKCSIILNEYVCQSDECGKLHGRPSRELRDLYCQDCFDEFIKA